MLIYSNTCYSSNMKSIGLTKLIRCLLMLEVKAIIITTDFSNNLNPTINTTIVHS